MAESCITACKIDRLIGFIKRNEKKLIINWYMFGCRACRSVQQC